MRIALIAAALAAICALSSPPAHARPVAPLPDAELSAPIVQVDTRCGRGRHFVKAHRNKKTGVLVPGRCVRNKVVR